MKKCLPIVFVVCFVMVSSVAEAAWWDRFRPSRWRKSEEPSKKVPPAKPAVAPVKPAPPKPEVVAPPAKPVPTRPQTVAVPAIEDMSGKDIVSSLHTIFTNRQDVSGSIPGLVRKEDESGVFFEYNGVRLEDLDNSTLLSLYNITRKTIAQQNQDKFQQQQRQLRNLKRLEQLDRIQRQQRQLRDLKRIQDTNRQLRQLRQQRSYTPPKTYKPQKTYR